MLFPENDWLAFTLANPDFDQPAEQRFASGKVYFVCPGVIRFEPTIASQDQVVLSSGIHGNETAPMELLNGLVKKLLDGDMALATNALVIIGHPHAARAQQRFNEVNLNRLFNGAWQHYAGQEVSRARQLENVVADFFNRVPNGIGKRYHYDLHTAIRASVYERFAVHPFTAGQPYCKEQIQFYAACGLQAALLSHQPTSTFSYHSYLNHGAQAATIELGKVQPFGENDLTQLSAIYDALIALLSKGQLLQAEANQVCCFEVIDELINDATDYALNVPNSVRNFTEFSAGETLATSSKSRYCVAETGDSIVFPNAGVPIGQRSGLVVRQRQWQDMVLI